MDEAAIEHFLLSSPWFVAYAASPFRVPPAELVAPLMAEMLRSGAAVWQDGRLVAGAPFNPPAPGWARAATEPSRWPN